MFPTLLLLLLLFIYTSSVQGFLLLWLCVDEWMERYRAPATLSTILYTVYGTSFDGETRRRFYIPSTGWLEWSIEVWISSDICRSSHRRAREFQPRNICIRSWRMFLWIKVIFLILYTRKRSIVLLHMALHFVVPTFPHAIRVRSIRYLN